LPLAPDEAELAEELVTDGLAAGGLPEANGVGAAGLAAASAAGSAAADAAGVAIGVIAVGQADPAPDAEDGRPGADETVATPAGATEPASRG
jgi:hypothetical protein